MKPWPITNRENYEILAVYGAVKEVERKFFVIAAYLPPNYTTVRAKAAMKVIYDTLMDIKRKFADPYIIIAGDFNQWQIDKELEDFVDVWETSGGPTRGNRTIDRVFSNLPEPPTTVTSIIPPLHSDDNTLSDHNIVHVETSVQAKETSDWIIHKFRKGGKEAEGKFVEYINALSWDEVTKATGVEAKTACFQKEIDHAMDKFFPWQTLRKREGDLPWLDAVAKKKIARKKAIYRDEGKSERWLAACSNLEDYLEKRRQNFLSNQRNKLLSPQASKNFHKNVKNYKSADKPKTFNVSDLMPDKSDGEVAEEAAVFFNSISQEFSPLLEHEIPTSFERVLPALTPHQIAERLKTQKKPGSMVEGDIWPKLVNVCSVSLSVPLSQIFNGIAREAVWPSTWKTEHVTLIPKKFTPMGLADLRNISCTNFFSKVMESFLLQWTLDEVAVKANQYGGVKGCSTTHMLLNIWQNICSNLEDYRSSTVLTAIDYAKAFNRLSFQKCLQSFKKKGASSPVLRLLAAFLKGRTMRVRVGSQWSEPRPVHGGCPQGSILGVLLFNIATDDLEDEFVTFDQNNLDRLQVLPQARNVPAYLVVPPQEERTGTQVLRKKPTLVLKYVDDNIIVEKLNFGTTDTIVINGRAIKRCPALCSQNAFRIISRNAISKGMKVNNSKTGLLCISDSLNHERQTYIEDEDGNMVENASSLNILGFHFSEKPTVQAQVDNILKKFRRRYWFLWHLGRLGFTEEELVIVYKTNILPVADYTDVVYHSLLTDEQDEALENAQNAALRCIFNPRLSARRLRKKAGIKTLRQRRIDHVDKFARKCANSEKFGHLFPTVQHRRTARNRREVEYVEEFARCDRLKNSPLFFMRRRLNGKPGKEYGERYREYREEF